MRETEFVKVTVQHWRKEGVKEEDFVKWCQEEQVPRYIGLVKKHGFFRWTMYFTPSASRAPLEALLAGKPGYKVDDYDVVLNYYAPSLDNVVSLMSDPEFVTRASEPEQAWVDTTRAHLQIGHEVVYLDYGEFTSTLPTD
ncbi:hypothetical protein F5Y04DRAFT_275463 [Hypomontagnella monticulosa]|nr:hypothetical protein F5Y04DRAFT_275463 [Hypomontagnella monticulosa]